jgi:hypothetical protein
VSPPLRAAAHERRVARRLEARGLPGLGEALVGLAGTEIAGRWRVDSLYAVGAEGAVYLATDMTDAAAAPCVVKIPVLPLHRPVELSSSLLRHRRESLRTEAANLEASRSPYMPASLGLHEFASPLLDARRGGAFAEPDPALVMERLPGHDVDLWLARVHGSDLPRPLLRRHLDRVVVVLLQALHDLQERGFVYADLRPGNLRVSGRPDRRVRLLDAGSLVAAGDESGRFPHVPHYLPPALYERRYTENLPIVPTQAVQAVMAGRTLFEVATGIVPIPGAPTDARVIQEAGVSTAVADVVDGLASGSFSNVVPAIRYLARRATRRVVPVAAPAPAPAAAPVPVRVPALELEPLPATPAARPALVRKPAAAAAPKPAAAPAPGKSWWRRLVGSIVSSRRARAAAPVSR